MRGRASKRGGAYLQAAMNMNSAASKQAPVRERAGGARALWAKAAVQAADSGAARNHSGVKETGMQGKPIRQLGRPSRTRRRDRRPQKRALV